MARRVDRSEAFSGRATDRTSVSPQTETIQGEEDTPKLVDSDAESEVGDIMGVGDDDDDDDDDDNDDDDDENEEDMEVFWGVGEAERLKTDKEDKFIRKLVDPQGAYGEGVGGSLDYGALAV